MFSYCFQLICIFEEILNTMSTTISIHPRKEMIKKDGTTPLYIWITIDRKVRKYILDHSVDVVKWDWNKMKVRGSTPNSVQLNTYITDTTSKAQKVILDIQNAGLNITHDSFKSAFFRSGDMNDFFTFSQSLIEKSKGKLAVSYIRQLQGELTKLSKFRSKLSFKEINHKFFSDYEYYMRNTLNNTTNTVFKTFKRMKTIIHEAMRQNENLYIRSPFYGYRLKTEPTHRSYLTNDELDKLIELRNTLPEQLNNVLTYFLFSCFTGLRYQDIKDLRFGNIEDGRIKVIMNKTKDEVVIPLLKKTRDLLPAVRMSDEYIFNVLPNQKTNDYLKEIMEAASITKSISFHCARHTFATTALNKSIPLEVVQKLLGHREIKTTQVYAKMMNETIDREMKKME